MIRQVLDQILRIVRDMFVRAKVSKPEFRILCNLMDEAKVVFLKTHHPQHDAEKRGIIAF